MGDREIPDHPLVKQTIDDCLTEAMDIDGLEEVLRRIEHGEIRCIARDLPEPSPLAAEILNARPYAFLDNAPLEERRTQAVYTRRSSERNGSDGLGVLDAAAIEKVKTEAWPEATNPDELHDALMLIGAMPPEEIQRNARNGNAEHFISMLIAENRSTRILVPLERGDLATKTFYVAAERLPMLRAIYPNAACEPELVLPDSMHGKTWERTDAIRELVRGRMEVCGPITVSEVANTLLLQQSEIDAALLALEAEGFVLRGKFHPDAAEQEWCDRRRGGIPARPFIDPSFDRSHFVGRQRAALRRHCRPFEPGDPPIDAALLGGSRNDVGFAGATLERAVAAAQIEFATLHRLAVAGQASTLENRLNVGGEGNRRNGRGCLSGLRTEERTDRAGGEQGDRDRHDAIGH